jgi:hypothetical protein
MNRTCLVSRASAPSSATWGSSASKVRRSAPGCSAISARIRLGTTTSDLPEKWTSPAWLHLTVAPREKVARRVELVGEGLRR